MTIIDFSIWCGFGYFVTNYIFEFGMVHVVFSTLFIVIKLLFSLPIDFLLSELVVAHY